MSGPGGCEISLSRFWRRPLFPFGVFPTRPLVLGEVSVHVDDELALRVVHGCQCLTLAGVRVVSSNSVGCVSNLNIKLNNIG